MLPYRKPGPIIGAQPNHAYPIPLQLGFIKNQAGGKRPAPDNIDGLLNVCRVGDDPHLTALFAVDHLSDAVRCPLRLGIFWHHSNYRPTRSRQVRRERAGGEIRNCLGSRKSQRNYDRHVPDGPAGIPSAASEPTIPSVEPVE